MAKMLLVVPALLALSLSSEDLRITLAKSLPLELTRHVALGLALQDLQLAPQRDTTPGQRAEGGCTDRTLPEAEDP